MKKIIVLIGYPGSGKTTLAGEFINKHNQYVLHDVYQYIKQYKNADGGLEDESMAKKAYEDMYSALERIDQDVILELGTNYPEINADRLKDISNNAKVSVCLCLLSVEECYLRVKGRGRPFAEDALKRRLGKAFPDEHEKCFEKNNLKYHYLQMGQTMDEQIQALEEIIKD
jgi:tRNA uridine 5-carbamoylmethylation protein Kti12